MSNRLKSSVVTITGGTGSFGSTMVRQLLFDEVSQVRVFSLDKNQGKGFALRFGVDKIENKKLLV